MDKQTCIVDFATRSFRDVADRDYICARACYRLELDQQFLWAALQAVEKYLKGILLFNNKRTFYGHKLVEARNALASISDIQFQISQHVDNFIGDLDQQGNNRYFTFPFRKRGEAIFLLDEAVWSLRRYCQNLRFGCGLEQNLKRIHSVEFDSAPNRFRIPSGFLEAIVDGKSTRCREDLLWCNLYFGKKSRRSVKPGRLRSASAWPTHSCSPDYFQVLRDLVKFEPQVIRHFEQMQSSPSATPAPAASQKSPA
jgi:hypothetical protein